jgi:uncharacterized protein YeaO (DUF488 family)
MPVLAPSHELVSLARAAVDDPTWQRFVRRYRSEMNRPEASRALDLLAALSHQTNVSVGCYCADEARCHRSILRELLVEHGAELA